MLKEIHSAGVWRQFCRCLGSGAAAKPRGAVRREAGRPPAWGSGGRFGVGFVYSGTGMAVALELS